MRRRGAKDYTRYNDAIRLERDYGDLEAHYKNDAFREIMSELAYDARDQARGRENPSRMEFDISAESGTADYYRKLSQNLSNYRSVLKAYSAFLESVKAEAYHAVAGRSSPDVPQATSAITAVEGARRFAAATFIERRSKMSRAAKALNREQNDGVLRCAGCSLSDAQDALFDVHHLLPLTVGPRETTISDLVVLCPTCHRLAHVKSRHRNEPLAVKALRDVVAELSGIVAESTQNPPPTRP